MKKIILFASVISAFSFASCKKDRVCTCVYTTNPGGSTYTDVKTYTKAKKGDAMSHCLNGSSTSEYFGQTYTTTWTCTLK